MANTSHRLTYRADIDGLRAVAVVAVVLFHAGLGFGGGYAGVDIFFVISGFLITGLILKDLRAGTFSITHFWERRARRILPAMAATVIVTLVVGWFLLFPEAYSQLAKSVMALVCFGSNINFWLEDDYFGAASESKPLLHTWSLSVEEQFYFIIPTVFIVLFHLWKGRLLVPAVWIGLVASLLLSIYAMEQIQYRTATFFLLPTRAWELLAGSLLAVAPPIGSGRIRSIFAWSGLAAILATFFLYQPDTPFPGYTAVLPVLGTVLMIWSGSHVSDETKPLPLRWLAMRPMVFVGLISYSFYLIHWPFFAYHHSLFARHPSTKLAILFVVIAFLLSIVSWKYVEKPFRKGALIKTRKGVFGVSLIAMLVLLAAGFLITKNDGFEGRFSPDVLKVISDPVEKRILPVRNMSIDDVPNGLTPMGDPDGANTLFLWGDSHADAVMPGIDAACKNLGVSGLAATSWVTPPVKNWYKPDKHGKNELSPAYNSAVFESIKAASVRGESKVVVLAASWIYYTKDPEDRKAMSNALAEQIRDLEAIGCRVAILKQFPFYRDYVPRNLALNLHFKVDAFDLSMSKIEYLEQRKPQDEVFDEMARLFPQLIFIDPLAKFVDSSGMMRQAGEEGYSLYLDHGHVSPRGARLITEEIESAISSLLKNH